MVVATKMARCRSGMTVLNRSLITARIELEIIRLTRMPDRVRATGVALRIGRRVDDIRSRGGQRIDIRRGRVSDDVAEGMILLNHDDDVIKCRGCACESHKTQTSDATKAKNI